MGLASSLTSRDASLGSCFSKGHIQIAGSCLNLPIFFSIEHPLLNPLWKMLCNSLWIYQQPWYGDGTWSARTNRPISRSNDNSLSNSRTRVQLSHWVENISTFWFWRRYTSFINGSICRRRKIACADECCPCGGSTTHCLNRRHSPHLSRLPTLLHFGFPNLRHSLSSPSRLHLAFPPLYTHVFLLCSVIPSFSFFL